MHGIAQRSQERFEGLIVLVRQDLRRSHDTGLIAVIDRQQTAHERYKGLTRTHIALQQAVHLMPRLEIIVNLVNDAFLCSRQVKRQGFVQGVKTTADHWHREARVLLPTLHLT